MSHLRLHSLAPLAALTLALTGCPRSEPPPHAPPGPDASMSPDGADSPDLDEEPAAPVTARVATFNASLFRDEAGQLAEDLAGGQDEQARDIAAILQQVRPDIVLFNEVDRDEDLEAARILAESYLAVAQGEAEPLEYPHRYVPETNTGAASGVDLDGDGEVTLEPGTASYASDSHGYGVFPGQYGMVIYSRYPIKAEQVRSFRRLLWRDMPQNLMPTEYYSEEAQATLRLSSKNHVDVPVRLGAYTLHLLVSHPTPPSFDGEEDRNGRRNHDEIRLWTDYVSGPPASDYLVDDDGQPGGLEARAPFIVLGDLNSDPRDGDSRHEAIQALLDHERTRDPEPTSQGGLRAAQADGGANATHEGDPALDTADFSDRRVGNLRVDYALPSQNVRVIESGVFWPTPDAPRAELVEASDHRLVWVDLEIGAED